MQDERINTLYRLPAKRLHSVLEELKSLRCRQDKGEEVVVPVITLHLKSGRDMTGVLIGMEEDRHEQCILFHLYDSMRMSPTYSVVYLSPGSIEALTLNNIADIAHQFSFGKISRPAPTKLEMKRKLKGISDKFSEKCGKHIDFVIDWMTIPKSEESMSELDELVNDFFCVISDISDEAMAMEIITKSVQQIIFQNSKNDFVSLINDSLTVSTNMEAEPSGRLTRQQLRDMTEDAF